MRKRFLCLLLIIIPLDLYALPREWAYYHEVAVLEPGVVRVRLPAESLPLAQPGLQDLRVLAPSGEEIPFVVDRPRVLPAQVLTLQGLQVSLERDRTVVTGETPQEGLSRAFVAATIHTAAHDFLKPLTVEGSEDRETWVTLLRNQPIYRQGGKPAWSRFDLPRGRWQYWRLTLDDGQSPPIPIEKVTLMAEEERGAAMEQLDAEIRGIASDGRYTEVRLWLPASNLTVEGLELEPAPGLGHGQISLLARVLRNEAIVEQILATGTLRPPTSPIPPAQARAVVVLTARVPTQELFLRMADPGGMPPALSRVTLTTRPVLIAFRAVQEGNHQLLLGNPRSGAAAYDASPLRADLARMGVRALAPGPLQRNPDAWPLPPPPNLPAAALLDPAPWQYRKRIDVRGEGLQRLSLDPEVLARLRGRTADLRILREGAQIPYVVDATGLGRPLEPRVEPRHQLPRMSRWILELPAHPLPVTHLSCAPSGGAFQRQARLLEEVRDQRGVATRRELGGATWIHRPGKAEPRLTLNLGRFPESDRLELEIDNGDNPPVELSGFRCYYRGPALLFQASPAQEIALYYGNPEAQPPRYDLLASGSVFAAREILESALGPEEALRDRPWWDIPLPRGISRYLFWTVMGLVVLVLLGVIRKLLPSDPAPPDNAGTP